MKKIIFLLLALTIGYQQSFAVWEVNPPQQEIDPLVNKLEENFIWIKSYLGLAQHIVDSCKVYSQDTETCVKHVVWVSSSESWTFRKCTRRNNCFGLMQRTKAWYSPRHYESVRDSVTDWLELYKKNWRENNKNSKDWLARNYCSWPCSNRSKNYNWAISKLN